jgi:hypothetical protein
MPSALQGKGLSHPIQRRYFGTNGTSWVDGVPSHKSCVALYKSIA